MLSSSGDENGVRLAAATDNTRVFLVCMARIPRNANKLNKHFLDRGRTT